MCGIAGLFEPTDGVARRGLAGDVRAMTGALGHRGPDAEGFWSDPAAGLAFGHRRLSILDLSQAGAQPMHSHDGRYVITYNGEIYNFDDLRRDLDQRRGGIAWRGHSDTEVLIELIAEHGMEAALGRLDGMFALAVWDRRERRLTLARDAFGEKPVYYGWTPAGLVFASELKAFEAVAGFAGEIDPEAVASFFKYGYVPAPLTVWREARKLPPATCVSFTADDVALRRGEPKPYWEAAAAIAAARAEPFEGSFEEAARQVEAILSVSVRRRLASDVPLGALLSGGIDSSLVTALMQAAGGAPVRTFSIGMDEEGYDESGHARAVAGVLGTSHTELILTPADVQAAIPLMPSIYDEPFADSSQVPTYLVSRLARRDVTVALTGDGGDELFGGYNRYFHGPRIWSRAGRLPAPLRRLMGEGLARVPAWAVEAAGGLVNRELAAGRGVEKLRKLAGVLSARDERGFHDGLLAVSADARRTLALDAPPLCLAERVPALLSDLPLAERAMAVDTLNYMPDDVLTKVDRASMAVSLELRTPFLNRELFAFAWRLPIAMKLSQGVGKRVLRSILYRHVPRALVDRPKSGFAIPVGRWLRRGLRDWAEAQLAPGSLARSGLLDVGEVRRRWQSHLAGRGNDEALLWSVLMFQGWFEQRGAQPAPRDAGAAKATMEAVR